MNEVTPLSSDILLRQLAELTDEAFFAFQPDENKILYLNNAFEKIWNMSRQAAGTSLSAITQTVLPEDRIIIANAIGAIKSTGQKQTLEFRIRADEHLHKWIRVNAFVFEQDKTATIIGIATDITTEKAYNESLHRMTDKKNTILEILVHDLTSPLRNIQMSAQVLSEHIKDKPDETVMALLEVLMQNSKRTISMVTSFISKEFLETSEVVLLKQRADIVEKIKEVIQLYKQPLHVRVPHFHLKTSMDHLFVTIDEIKFMQVISNLLSNALKFTPEDGNITVSVKEEEKSVVIVVADNGIGIPAPLQPYLFDKYTRAGRTGINGEVSTGLGMSIVKTIVEWHNGKLWFESEEGRGSTFYVSIPKE